MSEIITASNLELYYGDTKALKNINIKSIPYKPKVINLVKIDKSLSFGFPFNPILFKRYIPSYIEIISFLLNFIIT